jgi:hypothetical protein
MTWPTRQLQMEHEMEQKEKQNYTIPYLMATSCWHGTVDLTTPVNLWQVSLGDSGGLELRSNTFCKTIPRLLFVGQDRILVVNANLARNYGQNRWFIPILISTSSIGRVHCSFFSVWKYGIFHNKFPICCINYDNSRRRRGSGPDIIATTKETNFFADAMFAAILRNPAAAALPSCLALQRFIGSID